MEMSVKMEEALNQLFNWKLVNVPELEYPVLLVFEYSPDDDQRPISIAFDYSGGSRCWLSEAKVRMIGDKGPRPYKDYRNFIFNQRKFNPYSIEAFPKNIFEDIEKFKSACRLLYHHIDWS